MKMSESQKSQRLVLVLKDSNPRSLPLESAYVNAFEHYPLDHQHYFGFSSFYVNILPTLEFQGKLDRW